MIGQLNQKQKQRYHSMRKMQLANKKQTSSYHNPRYEIILMPFTIGLSASSPKRAKSRKKLIDIIHTLHVLVKQSKTICFDFRNTNKVFSNGMILFYAEIHNLLNLHPLLKFYCHLSNDDKVNHVLYQLGLLKIFRKKFKQTRLYKDVIHWTASHGTNVSGKLFDNIIKQNSSSSIVAEESNLYGAFIEATKNAHFHAYSEKRKLSLVNKEKAGWWAFGQEQDGILSVAICDLGIGIPATIPKSHPWIYNILKGLNQENDANLIQSAIDKPSSRTGKEYRGNGLKTIAKIAQDIPGASLTIHSYKGCVTIDNIQGFDSTNHPSEVPGTIILWNIPIDCNAHTKLQ